MDRPAAQILLVEDNVAHVELILRAFEDETSLHLVAVGTLASAREWLAGSSPDLVIVDSLLPDGRGLELLQPGEGRKTPYPFLLLASQSDEKMAAEVERAGACRYVVKSYLTLLEMPRLVEEILEAWRLPEGAAEPPPGSGDP